MKRVPRADILRAEFASRRARHDMTITMTATVEQTEDAYWDLVATLGDYQVQRGSRDQARTQMELTGRQIAAGVRPESDRISAEGTLARRELGLVQAESAIAAALDRLRQILNLPRDAWDVPILVAQRQADLAQAGQAELAAAIAHRKARAHLERATGVLLRRRGIQLDVTSSSPPSAR